MELDKRGGKGKSRARARDASDALIVVAALTIVMPVVQVVSAVIEPLTRFVYVFLTKCSVVARCTCLVCCCMFVLVVDALLIAPNLKLKLELVLINWS